MKNVTVTLPDDLAREARIEAATRGKSLSKFISELVAAAISNKPHPDMTLEQFLKGPGYPGIAHRLPDRDKLYAEREDQLLFRYQSSGLRPRPDGPGET